MQRFQKDPFLASLDCHVLEEGQLADLISKKMAIDRIYSLVDCRIDRQAMMKIPWAQAVKHNCVAISFASSKGALEVVFSDPSNKSSVDQIQSLFDLKIIPVVAEAGAIRSVISKHYPIEVQLGFS